MYKRIILILSLVFGVHFFINAQSTYIVQQFGENLSNWAANKNASSALQSLENLCCKKPAFRIGDNIMQSLAQKNGISKTDTYLWGNYVQCLQKEVDKGIKIQISNIRSIFEDQVNMPYKGFQYASCSIKMSGSSNFDESALFILKDGKIAKIQNYETTIDVRSGKRKIKVDWSGIDLDENTEGFGVSYNYSKAFPIGASVTFTIWKFLLSADIGVNRDDDLYTTQKVDFNNILDYSVTRGEYDLKYYITFTPAFYLKYFAIGCGFGYASLEKTEYTDGYSVSVADDKTVSSSYSQVTGGDKYKFMLRPTIRGFIPCNDNFFISLSVNYDWILQYKGKSNISFGIGFHYLLDE